MPQVGLIAQRSTMGARVISGSSHHADGTNWRGSVARIAEEVLSSRGVDFALTVPARGRTNATWLGGDLVVRVAPSAGPADLLREAGLAACLPVQVGYPRHH